MVHANKIKIKESGNLSWKNWNQSGAWIDLVKHAKYYCANKQNKKISIYFVIGKIKNLYENE